jgi:hypothetical protein
MISKGGAIALGVLGIGGIFLMMQSTSGKLGFTDLVTLAQNAGFTGPNAYIAAAIALAESGGDPNVVGDKNITPGGSVGLWQINLKFHPEFDPGMLTDPQYNAKAAFSVYFAAGSSFSPWTTFKTGAYSVYIPPNTLGVNA